MSSVVVNDIYNPAINNLVQVSLESKNEYLRLEWIPCSRIADIEPTQIDNVYSGRVDKTPMTLVFLGSSEKCTPTLVSEFARIYSLPTHNYNNDDVNQFRRYSKWLEQRNSLIKG